MAAPGCQLTKDEQAIITKLLGSTASPVAFAVARLYLASPDPKAKQRRVLKPNSILRAFPGLLPQQWAFTNIQGFLVFAIDRKDATFVFQIYDPETFKLRTEFELYEDMPYVPLDLSTHAFEVEDAVAGFCFSSQIEARNFFNKVQALKPSAKTDGIESLRNGPEVTATKTRRGLFGRKKAPEPAAVHQISNVTAVRHNAHLGLNEDGTMNLDALPPAWIEIFRKAGIKKKDMKNPETAGMVMRTLQQNGYSDISQSPQQQYERAAQVQQQKQMVAQTQKLKELETTEAERKKAAEEARKREEEAARKEAEAAYNAQQMAAYEAYQKELAEYEEQMRRYEEEMAEYEREQALLAWEEEQAKAAEEAAKNAKGPPPALPPRKEKKKAVAPEQVPDMPDAPEILPKLETADPVARLQNQVQNQLRISGVSGASERPQSRFLLKPGMLGESLSSLKSVLSAPPPKMSEVQIESTLLDNLKGALQARRGAVVGAGAADDDDSEDDWSD